MSSSAGLVAMLQKICSFEGIVSNVMKTVLHVHDSITLLINFSLDLLSTSSS